MNMISTGAFLTEMDASNKQPTVAEKFAAVWEKKNAKAARAGGVSLMALSLAACGGSSSTTTTTTTPAADPEPTTPVTPTNLSIDLKAAIETATGGDGNDTFNAIHTTTSTVLTDLDTITGGAGDDTLSIADSSATAFALPTSMTMTGVENISLSHISDAAGDIITVDTTEYADVNTVSVVNAGTNITSATVNGKANLETVTVSGGSGQDILAVTIADAGTAGSATAATTDTITSISLTGVVNAATLTSDALTSITVKNVGGIATNSDGYIATTDTRTLTATFDGGTNGGIVDDGATTVNLNVDAATTNAGTGTEFSAATTLNVDVNAKLTAGTFKADAATDVNINLDAEVTAATFTTGAAKTIDITGAGAGKALTLNGAANLVITNSGSGAITLVNAIDTDETYVGGSGVDTVTFAGAGTKASTLGGGDDVATFSAAAGTGGSVDAGDGEDTVSLTAANAVTVSANATFEADIANFEVVSIGAYTNLTGGGAVANTISLANLDDINSVKLAGGATNTAALTANITGFSSGGTFEQTALLGANANVVLAGSFTGGSDVMNVKATATNGFANLGSLTIGSVETINITTNDSDTTAATTMFDLNMDAANATTINVSGDAGITFANGTHANVTTMDASGVTASGAAGVVTFTATSATNATITGGAGDDALTGGAANDTITGNAGKDTLIGGAGKDTISGGDAVDTITGGTGADTITGGAGNDIFIFGTSTGALDSGDGADDADKITDYTAGDVIRLEAANNVAGASAAGTTNATTDVSVSAGGKVTFAAADDTLAEMIVALAADNTDIANFEVVHFEVGGNTYLYSAGDDTTAAADDFLIELTGLTGMTTLTESTTVPGDFTIA